MTFRYLQRIEQDPEYYIENNYKLYSLIKLYKEFEEAEQLIQEYKKRVHEQYNKATQSVEQIRITARKEQNHYSSDKRVKIIVNVRKIKILDGQEVSSDLIYGDSKEYGYKEQSKAIEHVKSLLNKYEGSRYTNKTPYKKMEV